MKVLNGRRVKNALLAGIQWFGHFRRTIDRINVFPVADNDTGKNMYHAFQAAQKEIEAIPGQSAAEVAWAAARGSLMGGRGCSGMILSGFFAGFAEAVGDRKNLSARDLALAFQVGCMRARERIDHPVEGTILSVGEAAAKHAVATAKHTGQLRDVMLAAWHGAQVALRNTTRQLPVLREHQVVDAGGMGLMYFLEGMVRFNSRQPLDAESAVAAASPETPRVRPAARRVLEHNFCTEFIVTGAALNQDMLRTLLQPWGEDLMIAQVDSVTFKVHLHTSKPDQVLNHLGHLGRITWRKVDDMEKQHQHAWAPEKT